VKGKIKRCKGLVEAEIDSETVIMSIESGTYLGLNEVASRIWAMIIEPVTTDDIIEALHREYNDNNNQLREDVLALIGEMLKNNLIEAEL
jgi:hypothetical protein